MVLSDKPCRGEIWLVSLGAARDGEPGKTRPAIVVSTDLILTNDSSELIVVVPISSSRAPSALRIELGAQVGLDRDSRAICRAVRSVARSRLVRRIGHVDQTIMTDIEHAFAAILEIDDKSTSSPRPDS